jgi:hypothetical protein
MTLVKELDREVMGMPVAGRRARDNAELSAALKRKEHKPADQHSFCQLGARGGQPGPTRHVTTVLHLQALHLRHRQGLHHLGTGQGNDAEQVQGDEAADVQPVLKSAGEYRRRMQVREASRRAALSCSRLRWSDYGAETPTLSRTRRATSTTTTCYT